jgi:YwiC-like protein
MKMEGSSIQARLSWLKLILPKEHGTWSFILEPLVFALLIAPSWPGASLCLAVLIAAFARRPLKLASTLRDPEERALARRISGWMAIGVAIGFGTTLLLGGIGPGLLLLPSLVAGAAYLLFDRVGESRAAAAEIAGASSLAFIPAGVLAYAGWSTLAALAAAFVMLARVVPTILVVRSYLHRRKGETVSGLPALATCGLASLGVGVLSWFCFVPWSATIMMDLLLMRAIALLVWPGPELRPRQIGLFESAIGSIFVFWVGLSW